MKHLPLIVVVATLLTGCSAGTPAQRVTVAPHPDTPALLPIEMHQSLYLARLEVDITVSPQGLLHSVRIESKNYGPADLGPNLEHHIIREGQLTQAQMTALARAFDGFDALSDNPYGGVTDGTEIRLKYGNKIVTGGRDTPKQVWDAADQLTALAAKMPAASK